MCCTGTELRTSCMLGMCSTVEPTAYPLYFSIRLLDYKRFWKKVGQMLQLSIQNRDIGLILFKTGSKTYIPEIFWSLKHLFLVKNKNNEYAVIVSSFTTWHIIPVQSQSNTLSTFESIYCKLFSYVALFTHFPNFWIPLLSLFTFYVWLSCIFYKNI